MSLMTCQTSKLMPVRFFCTCNAKQWILSDWKNAAQAAINAIRNTGATNYILVPGNGWTGAGSWTSNVYDQGANPKKSNAETMLTIQDPINKIIFEVHQYFGKCASMETSE